MNLSGEILRLIAAPSFVMKPATAESHLYHDLGYDSLAFVRLLLAVEEAFSIRFKLSEMGPCLHVSRLIALVEEKIKETAHDSILANEP